MSRYDDIINLPHHISPTRKRMSLHDRVAQFAPFAAWVGYDAAVAETARLTETCPELDEQEQKSINERLAYIPHKRTAGSSHQILTILLTFRVSVGIILAVVLYIGLLKSLVWRKKK